ncbi:excinuclease ABC subunit UvrC [Candidatus Saccharibacteria bacterium]|nr:excinuclease ABC subunit UvrC [Candidatus Saccharibacteria bacterium]
MNTHLLNKLKELPKTPGVYFHKNADGETIYIGKAAVLRNRVRQYFQKSRSRDPKTEALVAEIADTEWIEVETELDALFLEAEMIRRYLPRYNILLRDDKSLLYVRIDIKSDHPTVTFTRRPLDDGADYFGPYIQGFAVKKALRLLRRIFPYAVTREQATMGSKLYEQIGLDPGLRSGRTDLEEYRKNLRSLMSYLRGNRVQLMNDIERKMKQAAAAQQFELAATLRNKLYELKSLKKQIIFSDREFMDISKDKGLSGLAELLGIEIPKRIEGYDISHMGGRDVVASQVVFTSGLPDKKEYRKYKIHVQQNNDFASMRNVISRRIGEKNVKKWGLPDLFLIDGGKGQLDAALDAMRSVGINVPAIGLAKREEEIVIHKSRSNVNFSSNAQKLIARHLQLDIVAQESEDFYVIRLGQNSDIVKLLQRIRDESHRFAVSYHSVLKAGRQTTSWLDEVPGIGPATKRKLIREFGSSRGVLQARAGELEKVLGEKQAAILKQYARAEKKSDK